MSHKSWFAFILILSGLLFVVEQGQGRRSAFASEQDKAKDAQTKRTAYTVQHRSAGELATALAKQFKGESGVSVLADRVSNTLLLGASPAVYEELMKAVAKLDRPLQEMIVEVIILQVALKKGKDGKVQSADVELKELSGPADRVVENIRAMQKKGLFSGVDYLELKAMEDQTATVRNRPSKPYVTGFITIRKVTGEDEARRTALYKDVGTILTLTPKINADRQIGLELRIEDDRGIQPEDGIVLGKDQNGKQVLATEFIKAIVQTKVEVASGEAALVKDVQMKSKVSEARTLFVVSAKVVP